MAKSDYRCCDVCDGKVFYDANLNYEQGPGDRDDVGVFRVAGDPQYPTQEFVEKYGSRLDYLGDWAVICHDCAKTYKCVIVPCAPDAESSEKEGS